jgi:hypothetical protein
MEDKLIRQLQEEDLFPNATPEEIKYREANRPPRVLQGVELLDVLRDVLCSIAASKVDESDIFDYLMNGTSLTPLSQPIGEMELPEVVEEIKKIGIVAGTTVEEALLRLVNKWEYRKQEYDKIEGI